MASSSSWTAIIFSQLLIIKQEAAGAPATLPSAWYAYDPHAYGIYMYIYQNPALRTCTVWSSPGVCEGFRRLGLGVPLQSISRAVAVLSLNLLSVMWNSPFVSGGVA
jgi:hypothetical protein